MISPQLHASRQGLAALRLRMGDRSESLGFLVSAGSPAHKESLLPFIQQLAKLPGVVIYATTGTSRFLKANGVANQEIYRISDDLEPSFDSIIRDEKVGMIINILTGDHEYDTEKSDAVQIRRLAAERLIYLVTEVGQAITTIRSLIEPAPRTHERRHDANDSLWDHIVGLIEEKGGIYNGHAHADKAFALGVENSALGQSAMRQKWDLISAIKRSELYSPEGLRRRIRRLAQSMVDQGVHTLRTFVDADSVVGLKAVEAGLAIRDEFAGRLKIEIGLQPLEGLFRNDEARNFFLQAADMGVDFIGALPSRDEDQSDAHLDLVMHLAKERNIGVDVHVDQANDPSEDESEQLARFTMKHGMEGRVRAVHSISLAAKAREKRGPVIQMMKDAGLAVVVCPSAALSMQQHEHLMAPIHNSIAPVNDLLEAGIPLALGCDNVADIFMPLSTGNMLNELWMFAEAARLYDADILANIACGNMLT